MTKQQRSRRARNAAEVRHARASAARALDAAKAAARAEAERLFPSADRRVLGLYEDRFYVEIWHGKQAHIYVCSTEVPS